MASPPPRLFHPSLSFSSLTLPPFPPPLSRRLTPLSATKNPKPKSKSKKRLKQSEPLLKESEDDRDDAIPQIVTDRMMRRMGLSVGIPLAFGLSFFPFFYYLKKVVKIDVPTWIPFGVSFIFFGSALLGVSYGIVSASWDPLREGSLLGWNEARRNWPVFWESLRGNNKD